MKFGLFFSFQVPPSGEIPFQEPYQDMLECLPEAEELGYHSAYTASHHAQEDGLCPGPLIPMAGAASVTEQMRIGTCVLLVPLYAPLKLAEDIAVLDNLSDGRFVFGVAPGYVSEEFEAHGIPREERVGRMEESLDLMQRAWTEDTFSFDGEYYEVPETIMTPKPVQDPHPPIWYGVSGPKMIQRAAKRRAMLVASPRHGVEELREHYDIYHDTADEIGWEPPEIPVIRELFIAETEERAEQLAAPGLEYLFQELYGAKSAEGERVLRNDEGEIITDKRQAAYEQIKERFVIGTPETAIEEIRRYEEELGTTELIAWMHLPGVRGEDAMKSVRLFAEEVIPEFRD